MKVYYQSAHTSDIQLKSEAFPKQVHGGTLYEGWGVCGDYITHAVNLCKLFSKYQTSSAKARLEPTYEYVELFSNASWYVGPISLT